METQNQPLRAKKAKSTRAEAIRLFVLFAMSETLSLEESETLHRLLALTLPEPAERERVNGLLGATVTIPAKRPARKPRSVREHQRATKAKRKAKPKE